MRYNKIDIVGINNIATDELIEVCPETTKIEMQYKHPSSFHKLLNEYKNDFIPQQKSFEKTLCRLLYFCLSSQGFIAEENQKIIVAKKKGSLPIEIEEWLLAFSSFVNNSDYINSLKNFDQQRTSGEWENIKLKLSDNDNYKNRISIIDSILKSLNGILTGKLMVQNVIAPEMMSELILEENSCVSYRYIYVLTKSLIQNYIKKRLSIDSTTKIRILAIGTSDEKVWDDKKIEFRDYTAAIEKVSQTTIISINEFKNEYFDVIVAKNIKSVVPNINTPLREIKSLLYKNGLLILEENYDNYLSNLIIKGLFNSGSKCRAKGFLVAGASLISSESISQVLENEGFYSICSPVNSKADLMHYITIGYSDGYVRIKQALSKIGIENSQETGTGTHTNKNKDERSAVEVTDYTIEEYVKKIIVERVSESLKVDGSSVDPENAFSEYGVDSIIGVQLVPILNKIFGTEIEITSLFDYSSVNQLAKYILDNFKNQVRETFAATLIPEGFSAQELIRKSFSSYATIENKDNELLTGTTYGEGYRKENGISENRFAILNGNCKSVSNNTKIAIIGISGRFGKSESVQDLWNHLANGDSLIEKVTRWDLSKYNTIKKDYCNYGSFVNPIDEFDPLFFNISGIEATYMDPQQRILLEECWKALEDAGYAGEDIDSNACGVYIGCDRGDYERLFKIEESPAQAYWGNATAIMPARIAYFLNLHGPAIAINTACSSSLVAIHLAYQSLCRGEINLALAGGIFIQSTPESYMLPEKANMLSVTGLCHTFDESADGYVPGEGVGVIVLKRLDDAVADRDHIYGVIQGSAVNQDGATNGITAPSAVSQERLETEVYKTFDINPEDIQMVEAHGTGTKLGDPIEVKALIKAFRKFTDRTEFCALGSIKSNLGHAIFAAGIAGVIKVLLCLQNKKIVPSLNYRNTNPHIQFKNSPFFVPTELSDWNVALNSKRRAAVSSFGFSGTNAHMVIEESPEIKRNRKVYPAYIIVLSANTKEQLRNQAIRIMTFCRENPIIDCADLSYTLMVGRKQCNFRLACVIKTIKQLNELLNNWLTNVPTEHLYESEIHNANNEQDILTFGNECIEKCLQNQNQEIIIENLNRVADLYIKGVQLNYKQLFSNSGSGRISLPTYPFANEKYWIREDVALKSKSQKVNSYLHPLLHKNTSDFSEQRFSSVFTGQEDFLLDHNINDKKVLPGVTYLEMARAGFWESLSAEEKKDKIVRIKNVVWVKPIIVNDHPVEVSVGFIPKEKTETEFRIYTHNDKCNVFCQGVLELINKDDYQSVDLNVLLSHNWKTRISSQEVYDKFRKMGVNYGPMHCGVDNILIEGDTALAKLSISPALINDFSEYVLHPSMLDLSFQSTMAFLLDPEIKKPTIPFSLNTMDIYGDCTNSMWAMLNNKHINNGKLFDIDLFDDIGNLVARMSNLMLRSFESNTTGSSGSPMNRIGEILKTTIAKLSAPDSLINEILLDQKSMEDLLCQIIINKLLEHGLAKKNYNKIEFDPDNLISEKYGQWLNEIIKLCEENELIKKNDDGYSLAELTDQTLEKSWTEWLSFKQNCKCYSDMQARILLAETAMQALHEILKGNKSATDVIFPKSSMELVEGIYKRNRIADYYNSVVAEIVSSYIEESTENFENKISLFEIGAGTGGTSEIVLKKIKPCGNLIREYCYSDVSKVFLSYGEKAFNADHSYLSFMIFDVERTPEEQGLHTGYYDIVLATNVLHATTNIQQTLRNARALLKKDGIIIINEISTKTVFDHLSFGLLDGWWRYHDKEIRLRANPGLHPDKWRESLEQSGFSSISFPLQHSHEFGQQIIVAQNREEPKHKKIEKYDLNGDAIANTIFHNNQESNLMNTLKLPQNTQFKSIRELVTDFVIKQIAEVLRIPEIRIITTESIEKYGIDSLLVVQLTNRISEALGTIGSTVLFECQTIEVLIEYLFKHNKTEIYKYFNALEQPPEKKTNVLLAESTKGNTEENFKKSHRFISPKKMVEDEGFNTLQSNMDIAVIGLSGRYPGAKNIDEFWNNLALGKSCITEIPNDRWNWKDIYDSNVGVEGTIYSKWGGFLDDVDKFDPLFFNLSPREAEKMDPQERLFLQEAYASIEDAGYSPTTMSKNNKVGVFVGVMNGEYGSGASYWSIANRLSYLFNFHGPSMAIDTACSSSLTAIHLACQSLKNGECNMAIAGGTNLILTPLHYLKLSAMKMLSSGPKCKAFGDDADGFVDGEGIGAVILKPLVKAIADRDSIYGVIKGSAINASGKTNGYTVPNPAIQGELICDALVKSGVDPRFISYIEAHGTGTSLGDPIEINGLTKAFRKYTESNQYCAIGSVKTNIGHTEGAAGIAGFTKVLLQMMHGQLVPSLHAENLNSKIDFSNTPFYVQRELAEWERPLISTGNEQRRYPRIAGISSFGAGGANAHLIVEEFIPKESLIENTFHDALQDSAIFVVSARNEEKLNEKAKDLLSAIENMSNEQLLDIAYTLQTGREPMEARLGFLATSIHDAKQKLSSFMRGDDGALDIYHSNVKINTEIINSFSSDEDLQIALDNWIAKRKYLKILEFWVKGLLFDWNRIYAEQKPNKVRLPQYPFGKERYWLKEVNIAKKEGFLGAQHLHPFVHQNASDFYELRFCSIFSGDEKFISGHKIGGKKFIPSEIYIEMARAAAEASGIYANDQIVLTNTNWLLPYAVAEETLKMNVCLVLSKNKTLQFEIYNAVENEKCYVYCQGAIDIIKSKEEQEIIDPNTFDNIKSGTILSRNEIYSKMRNVGIEYGIEFQTIEWVGQKNGKFIAKVFLPDLHQANHLSKLKVHPSILSASFQMSIIPIIVDGLQSVERIPYFPSLPYSMDQINILGACTSTMWIVVKDRNDFQCIGYSRKMDMEVINDKGVVCIRMLGLVYIISNQAGNERIKDGSIPVPREVETISTDKVLENITQSFANALCMKREDIDLDKQFIDMGLDSIIAVEWIKSINEQFGTSYVATKVYDFPTLRDFSNFISKDIRGNAEIKSNQYYGSEKAPIIKVPILAPDSSASTKGTICLTSEISTMIQETHDLVKPKIKLLPSDDLFIESNPLADINIALEDDVTKNKEMKKSHQQDIIDSLAAILCVQSEKIDFDSSLIDLGLDNILIAEWIKKLQEQIPLSLTVSEIYECCTIEEVIHFIEKKLTHDNINLISHSQ